MNDPLFSDAEASQQGVPAQGQPGQQGQPAEDRFERLERAMGQLAETVRLAAQQVSSVPAAPVAQRETESPDAFMQRFSTDPQGTLREITQAGVAEAVGSQVTPAMRTVLEATTRQLVAAHRADIDLKFGAGTYDELFKPQIERDIAQLIQVNPGAAANPETVEALVNRLYGTHFGVLRERERAVETARSRGVSHLVPGGGVPRLRALTGDELPDDVEQHLRTWERETGEVVDRKHFAKLYYTGDSLGDGRHRTGLAQYLQAIGADADTKRTYLGERQV